MATMRHQLVGDTFAMVHTVEAPTDKEWDAMLDFQRRHRPVRVLVFTDGGGPTTLQRGRLNDALDGNVVKAAIVTSSPLVRGIVTALSWFNPGIRSFPPDKVTAAMNYIEVPADQRDELMQHVVKLSQELKPGGLRCVVGPDERSSAR